MTPRRPLISAFAAIFLWAALPVVAGPFDLDGDAGLGGVHGVYLGDGRMLTASQARQLTLRARIAVFDYSPTGEKIAYEGVRMDHGSMSASIRIVDTWRSDPVEKTIATGAAVDLGDGNPKDMIMLAGWSGEGRYLMIERVAGIEADPIGPPPTDGTTPATDSAPKPITVKVDYECVDTQGDVSNPKVIPVDPIVLGASFPTLAWSPSGAQALIFDDANIPSDKTASVRVVTIYRPDGDVRQRIDCPSGDVPLGWLDEQSLLMKKPPTEKGAKSKFLRYEISGGAETEIPLPSGWYSRPELYFPRQRLVDPKSPDLTLETATGRLPDTAARNTVDACGIWIRRATPGKKYTAMPVGVAPGSSPPQTQWSPAGDAVAFVAHGDLFVTDLVKRDATAREKLDAGDHLDCREETIMATSNLKQIGLGILQYTQDYDQHLPPMSSFHDAVYPYIKSEDVFSLGESQFVYKGPNMGPIASIHDPASFVMGEMNTPCARVVLYADGHVKAFDK